jgi:hypothetical protein
MEWAKQTSDGRIIAGRNRSSDSRICEPRVPQPDIYPAAGNGPPLEILCRKGHPSFDSVCFSIEGSECDANIRSTVFGPNPNVIDDLSVQIRALNPLNNLPNKTDEEES